MVLVPSPVSSTYAVHPTYPPLDLLSFNPATNPGTLYPPPADGSLARPFNVSPGVYQALLHPAVPITVSIIYWQVVEYVNKLNKKRDHKPWAFSTTLPFYILVVAHNVGLAIFSGWTFFGMLNAITASWPGWAAEHGLAGAVDALCKINGPRGFGSAATYDMSNARWGFTDRAMKLSSFEPDSADLGRIWNEGLAYYGFFFYLSKLYEVVDTAIILAKGKESSNLQTYHHAGAMLCLWTGIRYMSPPIWMFTFINSGLHTLMYTYYTLSALSIRVPPLLKRTLTTLQITQIFFGTFYALLHLFIAYDIPVSAPYVFAKNLSSALPSAASTISTAAMSLASSADFAAWLKKAALRAAGEEGLAENVRNSQGETFGIDAVHAAQAEKAQQEVRYRMTTQRVHCLDTSGQVFAILLNAVYLLPLAYLFCGFFYNAYIKRAQKEPPKPTTPENIKKSAQDAVNDVEAKIKQAIDDTQGGVTKAPPGVQAQLDELHTKSKQIAKSADESMRNKSGQARELMQKDLEKMQEKLKALREKGSDVTEKAISRIKEAAANLPENAKKGAQQAQKGAQELGNRAKETAGQAMEKAGDAAAEIKQGAHDKYNETAKAGNDKAQAVKDRAKDTANEADEKTEDTSQKAQAIKDEAKDEAKDTANEADGKTEDTSQKAQAIKDEAKDTANEADEKTKDTSQKAQAAKDQAKNTANGAGEKAKDTSQKAQDTAKDVKKGAEDAAQEGDNKLKDAAGTAPKDEDDGPASKAPEDSNHSVDKPSDAGLDTDKSAPNGPHGDEAPATNGESGGNADETGKEPGETGNNKDEEGDKGSEPSTENNASGPGIGSPEEAKKDKQGEKKENWWSKR